MTLPRRLLSGQTHATTRRTSQRRLLLQPTTEVYDVVLYALGRALEKSPGVKLHAYVASTTHDHASVTDGSSPEEPSELPGFFQRKNVLVARALNAHYGLTEAFWRPGSYSNVEVHGRAALEAQLLYVWTNPVKDGIVERPEQWPGVMFLPEDFGRTFVARRPRDACFGGRRPAGHVPTHPLARREWLQRLRNERRARDRRRGRTERRSRQLAEARERRGAKAPRRSRSSLPEFVTITISPPPGYEDWPIEAVRAHFRARLEAELAKIHAERRAQGKTRYMGVAKVMAQDPRRSVGAPQPGSGINPRVACKERARRVAVLRGLIAWRDDVATKRDAWRRGQREVVFPAGVYGLWRFHGARVEGGRGPPRAGRPS